MKMLVFSDSHGDFQSLEATMKTHWDIDTILHLGDGAEEIWQLQTLYPHKCYHYVAGNNDKEGDAPLELVATVDGTPLYLCHGHLFSFLKRKVQMAQRAKEKGAHIAFYGHTHVSVVEEVEGVTLINPGAVKFGRDKANRYMVVEVKNGQLVDIQRHVVGG